VAWIEADTRRQAFYNDLSAGEYEFQVTASNNDGIWNASGVRLKIRIPPAWYQTATLRAIAVAFVIAAVIFVYLYRLQVQADSLKRRFDVRLQERTRLARDLHDTLLQTIQGSKMVADNAREHVDDPRQTARALERLSDWLERASAEGRAALESLRSSSAETNDLAAALCRLAEDCTREAQIKFILSTEGVVMELHPIARDEVYRIADEAIRNACAHSKATELRVELIYGRTFQLRIRDNGRGIAADILKHGRPRHYGLAGMRERASATGGQLVVSSNVRGTLVALLVPGQAIYSSAYPALSARVLQILRTPFQRERDSPRRTRD